MTVLRELVAKLGFQVDDAGFKKATDGVEKIKKGMEHASESSSKLAEGLVSIVEAVGFEETIRKCLELADGVETTGAVLDAVFGEEGSKAVQAWSDATGEWLGRSKDDLAAAAAGIGSLIQPMVGSAEKAAAMSEKLTEMGVDMASVFGGSDADAIEALRGGMAGMGRSLKRYGIVLEDTTLQEYAHTQGIAKKISEMTVAEKAELTYGFLLERTSKYAGDARKHSDSYTNSTKRLAAQIKTLGTDIGTTLLPAAAKLITGIGKLVAGFKEIAAKSYIVQSTLAVLTAGFVVMKWEAIAAFAVPLLSILAIAAALDELYTLFTGGQSKIGDWLDEMGGIGTAEKMVNGLKDAFDSLTEFFDQLPDAAGMWDEMVGAMDDVGFALDALTDKFVNFFDINAHMADALEGLGKLVGIAPDVGKDTLGEFDRTAGRGLGSNKLDIQGMSRQRQNQRHDRIRGESSDRYVKRLAAGKDRAAAAEQAKVDAVSSHDPNEDAAGGMSVAAPAEDRLRFGQARARAAVPPAASTTINNTVNNGPINMSVNPGTTADAARAAKLAAAAERRRTEQAIKHGGG